MAAPSHRHAACYDAGAFYKPHFDGDSRRVVTYCLYLNPGWVDGDGGCLGVRGPPARDIALCLTGSCSFKAAPSCTRCNPCIDSVCLARDG
jgi:2OG-Fe(II) oxygenase superfamily